MENFSDFVKANPESWRQYSFKGLLFLILECPPDFIKGDEWSEHNCFLHILTGNKRLSNREESMVIGKGDTVFAKKGALTIEKLGLEPFCLLMFYVPDEYLRSFIRQNTGVVQPMTDPDPGKKAFINIHTNPIIEGFYDSVIPYFTSSAIPSENLLELKFRELLLNIISDENNRELTTYFCHLVKNNSNDLREVMENNCFYNLQLHEYARLCHRSLSTYKRDFFETFGMPPGRWLLEKRLKHATELLLKSDKSVSDVVIESGFTNISHFDTVFKKQHGLSPLQYRKQNSSVSIA